MHLIFTPLLIISLCLPVIISAQDLHTYVDRDSVRAGDIIAYTLVLEHNDEFNSVSFPDEGDFVSDTLQFIDRERYHVSEQRDSVVYRLQYFGTEDYQIPQKNVILVDASGDTTVVQTSRVPLSFKTVLAEGDTEFRPLKPIFDFAISLWPWILAILLITIAGWLFYKWYVKREKPLPPPPPPDPVPFDNPVKELEKELQALSSEDSPLKRREFKEFYILLGDSIRRYFERVYNIGALEMTSGELLRELRSYPAETQIINSTRKVLNEADMVKFARFEPDIPQAEKALSTAWQFHDVVKKSDKHKVDQMRDDHQNQQNQIQRDYKKMLKEHQKEIS